MQVYTNLISELKNYFGKELKRRLTREFKNIFSINKSRIRDIAFFFNEKEVILKNVLINEFSNKYEIIYEYFCKMLQDDKYIFIATEVDKASNEIDSIRIVFPNIGMMEDEITKRYGLIFLYFKEEMEESLYLNPASLFPIHSSNNLLSVGIFNKIHLTNNYIHFHTENEKISSVDIKTGWLYRGIIPLLNNKNWQDENLQLTEKICSTSTFHHSLAYSLALESLLDITVSDKVKLIRTLYCELERISNHILWFSNLLYLLKLYKEYYSLLNRHLYLIKLIEKELGTNYFENVNNIGYVKDLPWYSIEDFRVKLEDVIISTFGILYNKIYSSYFKRRCKDLGVLNHENAIESGVSGPNLRASGYDHDARSFSRYNSYNNNEIIGSWEVVTFTNGDMFSRAQVRLWEIKNSQSIVKKCLELLQKDESEITPLKLSNLKLDANMVGISLVEAPQGELVYIIKTADRPKKDQLGSVFIQSPSMNNFFALKNFILPNSNIQDLPLLVHSMDICFNCIDL